MAKKNINPRCPLALECERKHCEYITHEIDCKYYETNGWGESSIPDQEERRKAREEEHDRLLEGMEYEAIPDEEESSDNKKESQSKIVMLRVDKLHEHPDNPRKDVGDVTELAESIKANGILQNLTVVPYFSPVHNRVIEGLYTVIIGHRRLAASKLAGIKEVPCTIADMTPEEQIATMLTENMQRTDLTVYEQAKAFQQLTFDLGMTPAEIADMSGFSEATVKRRTKLADLDEKSFKKACERGATLSDFAELDKIEDPEAKQKVLDTIGTQNFRNVLKGQIDAQNNRRKMKKWIEQIGAFATRIEKTDYTGGTCKGEIGCEFVPMDHIKAYGFWTKDEPIEKPDDADEIRYFYKVSEGQLDVYKEAVEDSAEKEELRHKEEIRQKDQADWERMQEIQTRHKELRRDFVLKFGAAKSNIAIVMRNLSDAMIWEAERNYYSNLCAEDLCTMLEIAYDSASKMPSRDEYARIKAEQPERLMLIMAYWYMDKYGGYASHDWCSDIQRYVIHYKDNQKLDNLYYFLEELGYERSDEERQIARGTHELFYDGGTANE